MGLKGIEGKGRIEFVYRPEIQTGGWGGRVLSSAPQHIWNIWLSELAPEPRTSTPPP